MMRRVDPLRTLKPLIVILAVASPSGCDRQKTDTAETRVGEQDEPARPQQAPRETKRPAPSRSFPPADVTPYDPKPTSTPRTIAVIGTGRVGGTLGTQWAKAGHAIIFGSRDPKADKVAKLVAATGGKAQAKGSAEAAAAADVVVLAIPFSAAETVVKSLGDLRGKIVIDVTNPLADGLSGLTVGHTTSAAEEIARWATGASVVKAFNTSFYETMFNPIYPEGPAATFIAGDDDAANKTVSQLAADLGFDVVDAGPLESARYIEPMALLVIKLAFQQGNGTNIAFRLSRRE